MKTQRTQNRLRRGWSTGAYAAATSAAAFRALLTRDFNPTVQVVLPKGLKPRFTLSKTELGETWAKAGAIKDAGDDPDVTHGCEIISEVRQEGGETGVVFRAGDGVGTVTLPGLPLSVGEPAINPKPREMIMKVLSQVAKEFSVPLNLSVTISIPGGVALAKKTMNERLGIIGGLSILGTTGVVIPYSCASWINSIHRGIDVARATNIPHIVGSTGKTSEEAVKKILDLPDRAFIEMGDFAGGMLKYLRKHPTPVLTIAGGFGKLSKLAQGNLDLHSSRSELKIENLALMVSECGGDEKVQKFAGKANTALEILSLCKKAKVPIADYVAKRAKEVILATLAGGTDVQVLVFDRKGKLVGRSDSKL